MPANQKTPITRNNAVILQVIDTGIIMQTHGPKINLGDNKAIYKQLSASKNQREFELSPTESDSLLQKTERRFDAELTQSIKLKYRKPIAFQYIKYARGYPLTEPDSPTTPKRALDKYKLFNPLKRDGFITLQPIAESNTPISV